MKIIKHKSLQHFIQNYNLSQIGKDSLIISDIDGVFFKGIFDPREILGIISPDNLKTLEDLLKTNSALWIFTNRLAIFKYFPFIKQIASSIKKTTGVTPPIYSKCSEFLEDDLKNHAIIMNAKKPSEDSQKVVEKGIANFKNVIYIGSQDVPFFYHDFKLIKILNQKKPTNNLTFVEISPWLKSSK